MATTNSKTVSIRLQNIDAEKLESLEISGRELIEQVLRAIDSGTIKIEHGCLKVFTPEPETGLDTTRLEEVAAITKRSPQQILDMMLNKYAGY